MRPFLAASLLLIVGASGCPGLAGAVETTAEDTAAPPPSARDEALARHRQRLAREIATLEHELGDFPEELDDEAAARQRARVTAGLEVWALTDERSDLRARIDHLRQRITLIEQIEQRQDDLDRARLVEHQRVMADLASDRAVVRQTEDDAIIEVRAIERRIAAREAKREMLAHLRARLDALPQDPNAAVPPPAPPAPAATIETKPAPPAPAATVDTKPAPAEQPADKQPQVENPPLPAVPAPAAPQAQP
jgi:hypothetical protein